MFQEIYIVIRSCALLKWLSRHDFMFPYGDHMMEKSIRQNRRQIVFTSSKQFCLSVKLDSLEAYFQLIYNACVSKRSKGDMDLILVEVAIQP